MKSPATINANEAMRSIKLTVRVTGLRRLRARLWLGARIVGLAALVMGCEAEVLINGEPI
jgi:hypothetical protein